MPLNDDYLHLELFKGLTEKQLCQISPIVELRYLKKQQIIFNQGEIADYFYILINGKVAIRYKPSDGPSFTVIEILPGGVFGWSAILGISSYTCTAFSLLDGTSYRIADSSLRTICDLPDNTGMIFLMRLTSLIAQRVDKTHTEIMNILIQSTNCKHE